MMAKYCWQKADVAPLDCCRAIIVEYDRDTIKSSFSLALNVRTYTNTNWNFEFESKSKSKWMNEWMGNVVWLEKAHVKLEIKI